MSSLALQMWTVRKKAEVDLAATLREVKAIGLSTVETVQGMGGLSGRQMHQQLEEAGLSACSAHARLPEGDRPEDMEQLCREVVELGAPALIVSSLPETYFTDDESVARAAERMNKAAPVAAGYGLELGYHNHWWEFGADLGGRSGYEVFVERLDPSIALEVDTYWAQVAGPDAAHLVASLGQRVHYLHVKDGPIERGSPQCAVGQGRMDIPSVLAANPAVRWDIIELDEFDGEIFDAVRDSFAYLAPLAR
jgi:sugar phosphate isomerase/epimerase